MAKKTRGNVQVQAWQGLIEGLSTKLPHLCSWWDDMDDFIEIRCKARPDGTVLAVAKGYDSSGGKVVCFGVAYDVVGALMAVDRTIQSGNWRVDKPWDPNGE
jgi:hypothetical protein